MDYAHWLTKQQAAEAIGVSTKTVEAMAKAQQIQQAVWRRPDGGPARAVYHPQDVARVALGRRPGLSAFVLPPDPDGNGHGSAAIALSSPAHADAPAPWTLAAALAEFAAALRAVASQSSEASEKSEKSAPLFLTLAEAATASGLSPTRLRRLIADGTLAAIRDRGWRIRRRDLEAL
jgi:excisionase family DNA binding protein